MEVSNSVSEDRWWEVLYEYVATMSAIQAALE